MFIATKLTDLLEQEVIIQSADTRCISKLTVEVKPSTLLEKEGCLIQFIKH